MLIQKMSSLRTRLLTVLMLALSPAIVLIVIANWKMAQTQRIHAEQDARRLAEFIANDHRQAIETARGILQRLATRPGLGDAPAGTNTVSRPISLHPALANVGFLDRDGRLVLATSESVPGTPRGNRRQSAPSSCSRPAKTCGESCSPPCGRRPFRTIR
jgi:hypothetical protein